MPPFRLRRRTPSGSGVGSVIADRYELRELLGGGGMGTVYRAYDTLLQREVAVKALLPEIAAKQEFVERFRREGVALARLDHPNIIGLYDLVQPQDGGLYLVLELVRGRPLDALMVAGPLPWSRCADIGMQVCTALAAAHQAGVIHRDIKPSNVLIDEHGTVKVADFGVARLADASSATVVGLSVGTPEYFSPEQAQGLPTTSATDVYSLCVVLFEAATGRLPYDSAEGYRAIAMQHIAAPVPDPCEANPSLPREAGDLISAGLAKDADARPSVAEVSARLSETRDLPQEPPAAPSPPTAGDAGPGTPGTRIVQQEDLDAEALPKGAAAGAPASPPAAATRLREATDPTNGVSAEERAERGAKPPDATPATRQVANRDEPVDDHADAAADEHRADGATTGSEASAQADLSPAPAETRIRRHPVSERRGEEPVDAAPAAGATGRRDLALLIGAAIAVGLVGLLLGRATGGGDASGAPSVAETATPRTIRGGGVSTQVPADWVATSAAVPGLPLSGAAAYAPASGGGAVVVGRSQGSGPSLLPTSLTNRLADGRPGGEAVRLGNTNGLADIALPTRDGAERVSVFRVPTRSGVATVACRWDAAAEPVVRPACLQAASRMRVAGGVLPLDPDPAYARTLNTSFTSLASARAKAVRRLEAASTQAEQAAAAATVAAAYAAAATRLERVTTGPGKRGAHREVIAALLAGRRAFEGMASAARSGSAATFQAQERNAQRANARLRAAREGLRAYGYELG